MNTILKFTAAAAIVLVCSVDVHAQPYPYGYGYGRPGTYNYNCTGCYPGAGPYDSSIAVAGIAAGASVIGTAIGAIAASRQPAPTVVVQSPSVIQQQVVAPPMIVTQPVPLAIEAIPGCRIFIVGMSQSGNPVTVRTCP